MTRKKDNPQQRKRQINWFNPLPPPPLLAAPTTTTPHFQPHFQPHHKLHKLFNGNNVKRIYSCLPNIRSIINAHNRKILYLSPTIGRRTCNCINILQCPLQQKCVSNNAITFYTKQTLPQ